jgi:HlyD family secretion protein
MLYNDKGEMVHETSSRRRRGTNIETPVSASNEPPPGHTRKETEGVFAIRDGKAIFLPVKVGIAGEQYFEVLTGLNAGDQVITGPFASVRELADGENVRIQQSTRRTTTAKK